MRHLIKLVELSAGEIHRIFANTEDLKTKYAAGLREALDALPQELRSAVDLTFGQGLRLQDAARILDLPLGTVKSRLFRARQQLRQHLEASP